MPPTIDWAQISHGPRQWVPIRGFEGCYAVSDFGEVLSLARMVPNRAHTQPVRERVLSPAPDPSGYLVVNLKRAASGQRWGARIHRLVCLAFHGWPRADQEVCHNNGIKGDNRARNLRWDTAAANREDAKRHSKLRANLEGRPNLDLDEVRRMLRNGVKHATIAAHFKVSRPMITMINTGARCGTTDTPGLWEYGKWVE